MTKIHVCKECGAICPVGEVDKRKWMLHVYSNRLGYPGYDADPYWLCYDCNNPEPPHRDKTYRDVYDL